MADVVINPQGYLYGGAPEASHPFWDENQLSPVTEYVKTINGTTDTTDEGTTYTISKTDGKDVVTEVLKMLVPKQGVQEAVKSIRVEETKGSDKDTYVFYATDQDGVESTVCTIVIPTVYVKTVTVTNENGVYTVGVTGADGVTTESVIEVPEVNTDNLIAEINDAVVEDETNGYDFHTLTETENNGTVNEVGKFYLARNQIIGGENDTSISNSDSVYIRTIGQDGVTSRTRFFDTPSTSTPVHDTLTGRFFIGDGYIDVNNWKVSRIALGVLQTGEFSGNLYLHSEPLRAYSNKVLYIRNGDDYNETEFFVGAQLLKLIGEQTTVINYTKESTAIRINVTDDSTDEQDYIDATVAITRVSDEVNAYFNFMIPVSFNASFSFLVGSGVIDEASGTATLYGCCGFSDPLENYPRLNFTLTAFN